MNNRSHIPQTDSIQELAKFWDSHDLTDFESELVEVTEPVFERSTPVVVHLESREAVAITELAKGKGVTPDSLIQEWVREKLRAA